ncbi:hypothetical protein [Actinomadura sp. SCN-SB]|uniref:hypothetical protein n=1 Tax=Actinomadura sp. SCN-SB TaxID=3373092 RepID=UPI003750DE69
MGADDQGSVTPSITPDMVYAARKRAIGADLTPLAEAPVRIRDQYTRFAAELNKLATPKRAVPASDLDPSTGRPVTPEHLQGIALLADELAEAIRAAHTDFQSGSAGPVAMTMDERTTGDLTRRAGFRLPEAAGQAREVGRELRAAAETLERIAAVPTDACRIGWPVCPQHGNTISATGGRSWCRAMGCDRRWDYDRGDIPCPEPVRWRVTDAAGGDGLMCDGHALDARTRLAGGTVVPLGDEPSGRDGGR